MLQLNNDLIKSRIITVFDTTFNTICDCNRSIIVFKSFLLNSPDQGFIGRSVIIETRGGNSQGFAKIRRYGGRLRGRQWQRPGQKENHKKS